MKDKNIPKDLMPRNKCLKYMLENKVKSPVLSTKSSFDYLAGRKRFSDGPFLDDFGGGYGEPYIPFRQAFGTLDDGSMIYCETNPLKDEEARRFLEENGRE